MHNCSKCNKEFKTGQGRGSHEKNCDGIGTGIKRRKKPPFICPKCGIDIKTSRENHVNSCDGNGPRRRKINKNLLVGKGLGQNWEKGKTFDELYGIDKSKLIREKISKSLFGISKGVGLTEEIENSRREKIRISINKKYENGWESTAGRSKKYDYESPIAGKIKVDGTWELKTCKYFDDNNYNWVRNKKRFNYVDIDGKNRTYCPDFHLIDLNMYIEVKGYTTELDRTKWKQFPEKLEIWDKKLLKSKKIL